MDLLEEVTGQLKAENDSCIGILLYGSFSRGGADRDSDLDVIVVLADLTGPPNSRITFKFNPEAEVQIKRLAGIEIDVFVWNAAMIRNAFSRKHPGNNNLFLNAFTTGKVLYDKDGTMMKLVDAARRERETGPPAINPKQVLLSWMTLHGRLTKIRRMAGTPEPMGMFRFLCDSLLEQTLHCYYGSHRLWSAGLDESLKNAEVEDSELWQLCEQYWRAASPEEFVAALEALVDAAAAPIRELIDQTMECKATFAK